MWSMSLRVTVGESTASPAATRRIARRISVGGVSLTRNPAAPSRSASEHVVVDVERRQDDDLRRVRARARTSRVAARPSSFGIRMSMRTTSGRWASMAAATSLPSSASPTTSRSRRGAEHHRQPGAHERVVVDDQHAESAGASRRPRQPRPQAVVAGLRVPVLEPPAGELDALGQPDQARARARDRGMPELRERRAADDLARRGRCPARRRSSPGRRRAARACARSSVPPGRSGRPSGRSPSAGARRRRSARTRRRCRRRATRRRAPATSRQRRLRVAASRCPRARPRGGRR